ncbi:Minf_1886 family protein [Gemmatimonadota bacterium]
MEAPTLNETLGQLQRRNPRYAVEAYVFVLGGLHRRLAELDRPRHISGAELAGAVRDLAIDRFGLLARVVLEHWGVHSTEDIGEIVFLLVDHGVLAKEETDRREDFADVFSFEEVFELEYPWGAPGR